MKQKMLHSHHSSCRIYARCFNNPATPYSYARGQPCQESPPAAPKRKKPKCRFFRRNCNFNMPKPEAWFRCARRNHESNSSMEEKAKPSSAPHTTRPVELATHAMPAAPPRRSHRKNAIRTKILPGIASRTRENAKHGEGNEEKSQGRTTEHEEEEQQQRRRSPRRHLGTSRPPASLVGGPGSTAQGAAAMWTPGGGSQSSKSASFLALCFRCAAALSFFFPLQSPDCRVLFGSSH